MFVDAIAFNQPLDEWDLSSIRGSIRRIVRGASTNFSHLEAFKAKWEHDSRW